MAGCRRAALLLALALVAGAAAAQEVRITADSFVVSEGEQRAVFSGNVVVEQPDLIVRANRVTVHYGEGGASDIERMEAEGALQIETPEQNVTGQRGVYTPADRIMRVTGNVVVVNEQGTVSGPELLVNLATNTSEFVATPQGRVTGVFNP